MINEYNELVMELIHENEFTRGLVRGKLYDVKFANSGRRKGLIIGKNRAGNYELLTNFEKKDLIKLPRKYSFDNFYVEGNKLDVPQIKNVKIISQEDKSLYYLIKKLESAEK